MTDYSPKRNYLQYRSEPCCGHFVECWLAEPPTIEMCLPYVCIHCGALSPLALIDKAAQVPYRSSHTRVDVDLHGPEQ